MKNKNYIKFLSKLHPDKLEDQKIKAHNYYAKKRGDDNVITLNEWKELKAKFNYTCLRCHQREPSIILTLDHVVPVSKGGVNIITNIQPLCGPCNYIKGRKATDYRQEFEAWASST